MFALPRLAEIDDGIANGTYEPQAGEPLPLSLFTAERVDLALQRLVHYTATAPEHFQRFVLFTNYQRYVNAFVSYRPPRKWPRATNTSPSSSPATS